MQRASGIYKTNSVRFLLRYGRWNDDGSENRYTSASRSFGPRFDGKPFYVDGQEMIYSAKDNNGKIALSDRTYEH